MNERVIGVLGGMGPEATLAFYARLIENTEARRDQDHVRVLIDSNPKIPDRTEALLGNGESPVPLMTSSVEALQRAGAEFIVIPCVSAHVFLEELRRRVTLPVLSIFDAAAEQVRQDLPGLRRVGLLATSGTVTAGRFQQRLAESGFNVIVPDTPDQARLMAAIYGIKASAARGDRARVAAEVRGVAERVVALGAEAVLLGCTELPLVLGPSDLDVPVIDSLLSLARATLRVAGREPIHRPVVAVEARV
ncbi:MAG: amino acid racemase [Vicinamibacteria bacterium]